MKRALFALLTVLFASCASMPDHPAVGEPVLVMISIDGLRPEFYLDASWPAPMLQAMARQGACAEGVESVFPSVTYPAHATIVTGVSPARHGIAANTKFTGKGGARPWYTEAKDIHAKTLWQAAHEKGVPTALFGWPTTVGAEADLLQSELPSEKKPNLAKMAFEDDGICKKVEDAIAGKKARLVMAHFSQVDAAQHEYGRDAGEVRTSLAAVDALVARAWKACTAAGVTDHAYLMVMGDHGFFDVPRDGKPRSICPNALLRKEKMIQTGKKAEGRIEGWTALAHVSGAQCAVYVSDPERATEVEELFWNHREQGGEVLYNIHTRAHLDEMGYAAGPSFVLEAVQGYTMSGTLYGAFLQAVRDGAANHGYLPTHEGMRTGFEIIGPGVAAGGRVTWMRLQDIAPIAAWVLGLEMPEVEGKPVRDFFMR